MLGYATQIKLRDKLIARASYRVALFFLGILLGAGICCAQNTDSTPTAPPPAAPPRPQFFAGTVTAITDKQITVSRTLVGHPPDTRIFQLTPKTKLNRNSCKVNTKVTVRYQHLPEGDVALQVLVHPNRSRHLF